MLSLSIVIFLQLISVPLLAAPSFDCKKARLLVEKLICEDQKLAEADQLLHQTYQENLKSNKNLIITQKRWLLERNRCKDKICLEKSYTNRLNIIDPFADKNITCEKMQTYTQRIFNTDSIDLGSGSISPIHFDFDCPDSLASLPFLSNLRELAAIIRGKDLHTGCFGSKLYADNRYYLYLLAKAGFMPVSNVQYTHKELAKYFRQWSLESLYNFRLYEKYLKAFGTAKLKLAEYYKTKFKFSLPKAKLAAEKNLGIISNWAAGDMSEAAIVNPSMLIKLAADKKSTAAQMQKLLRQQAKDPKLKQQAYDALKISLLLGKPQAYLQLLRERIGNLGDKNLDRGNESEIFFALNNKNNLTYLLENGALINHENNFGKTVLFYAIESGDHELVKFLISRGANVNQNYKTKKELHDNCHLNIVHTKRTPLMHAAQHSDEKMLELLLHHKARLQDIDEIGFNALDYAVLANNEKSQIFLKARGLKPKKKDDLE